LVITEYVDAAGAPSVPNKRSNAYRSVDSYDDRGNLAGAYFQNTNGDFVLLMGVCKTLKSNYDERGNPAEAYCIRQDGQLSETSWALWRNKFDDDDQVIENTYFDRNGHPVLGPDGEFRDKLKYDPDGDITEYSSYGTDGKPIINSEGFHKKISEFKSGHEVRREYATRMGGSLLSTRAMPPLMKTTMPRAMRRWRLIWASTTNGCPTERRGMRSRLSHTTHAGA